MPLNIQDGNLHINGNLSMDSITLPAGALEDDDFASDADIDASKLQHAIVKTYAQKGSTAAEDGEWILHEVMAATGNVLVFSASSVVACVGGATVTVDLLKGGTSVLSTPIVLNSATGARTAKHGAILTEAGARGDVYSVQITGNVGGGTLAKGVSASMEIVEGIAADGTSGAVVAGGGKMVKAFTFASTSPLEIGTIPAGMYAVRVTLLIGTAFDTGSPTLTVGDSGDTDRLMLAGDNLPKTAGVYLTMPMYLYAADTVLNIYIVPDTATAGAGVVVVEYV